MKTKESELKSDILNYRHLITKIAASDFKFRYKNYGLTEKLDGIIMKNKPQINADERRFIANYYESNWISCFSVTPMNPDAKVIYCPKMP